MLTVLFSARILCSCCKRCWVRSSLLLWIFVLATMVAASVSSALNAVVDKQLPKPGKLLYHASMGTPESVSGWLMEGPGEVIFKQGGMKMFSPNKAMHHVFWCPKTFPDSFIARWKMQNLDLNAGLLIVFFAAAGTGGEDIFDPGLPSRDGTFKQYTQGRLNSYHISYYANAAHNPNRGYANLRKNSGFKLLQQGSEGIPTASTLSHQITLVKQGPRMRLFIDERKVIDYSDDQTLVNGVKASPALSSGKIGFRQMQWTHFRYSDFRVNAISSSK